MPNSKNKEIQPWKVDLAQITGGAIFGVGIMGCLFEMAGMPTGLGMLIGAVVGAICGYSFYPAP